MATSTSTAPRFKEGSKARVMSLGALAPGTSTAPMIASALAASSRTVAGDDIRHVQFFGMISARWRRRTRFMSSR